MHTTHSHSTRGLLLKLQPHKTITHTMKTMRWVFFFLQGILWQRKGPVCANVWVLMCLLFCELFLWVRERERSNEWERETDTQIPSYALGLIAFLQGVSSVVKRRGVNSSQSVIPGWRSFLSTLKPCMNKTPGQYQDHPSVISSLKLQF